MARFFGGVPSKASRRRRVGVQLEVWVVISRAVLFEAMLFMSI